MRVVRLPLVLRQIGKEVDLFHIKQRSTGREVDDLQMYLPFSEVMLLVGRHNATRELLSQPFNKLPFRD